jgi:hypothetical protein
VEVEQVKGLAFGAWLGQVADYASTKLALSAGAHEGNPLVAPWIEHAILGPTLKLGLSGALIAAAAKWGDEEWAVRAFIILMIVSTALTAWNVTVWRQLVTLSG